MQDAIIIANVSFALGLFKARIRPASSGCWSLRLLRDICRSIANGCASGPRSSPRYPLQWDEIWQRVAQQGGRLKACIRS